MIKTVAVFCGSSKGLSSNPSFGPTLYLDMAHQVATHLSQAEMDIIYGGAKVGLMGKIADVALEMGRSVTGVIPKSIVELEVAHEGITSLEVVENMHERKMKMYDLSDAFLALPGGIGTLDELCEIMTWSQLNIQRRPIVILNYKGFFDAFLNQLKFCIQEGFLNESNLHLFKVANSPHDVVDALLECHSSLNSPEGHEFDFVNLKEKK